MLRISPMTFCDEIVKASTILNGMMYGQDRHPNVQNLNVPVPEKRKSTKTDPPIRHHLHLHHPHLRPAIRPVQSSSSFSLSPHTPDSPSANRATP